VQLDIVRGRRVRLCARSSAPVAPVCSYAEAPLVAEDSAEVVVRQAGPEQGRGMPQLRTPRKQKRRGSSLGYNVGTT
jgi:hypothetical protein